MGRWRIGLVVPRYGEEILGGAETLARCLAEQVAAAGLAEVEVFTTCARDHIRWQNELPAGPAVVQGVPVRRFPIDAATRDAVRYEALHLRLIQREKLPAREQYEWVHHSAHSPALYAHLEARQADFDFILFIPYLFGTTFYGTAVAPGRAVLWPCLHDEVYAYLDPTRDLVRTCLGVMFNTYPEMRLAERLYGAHPGGQVVGFGMDPLSADAGRFREAQRLAGPFVLYSGRLEGAKNVPLLIDYFIEYKRRRGGPLRLALMGVGPDAGPEHPDIARLGFQQGQPKLDAYAAAALLCQPSVNESFSIVIMESWLLGVPVLVHSDCAVTRYHAARSGGGLHFRSYSDFEAALDLVTDNPALGGQLGRNGQAYVLAEYSWDQTLRRFEAALAHWQRLKTAA